MQPMYPEGMSLHQLAELVSEAHEEEWAIAATTMMSRMLQAAAQRGSVPIQWLASLQLFGLAEPVAATPILPRGQVSCRLTPAGREAARMVVL